MSFQFRHARTIKTMSRWFGPSVRGLLVVTIASLLLFSTSQQAQAGGSWGSSHGGFGSGGSSGFGSSGGSYGCHGGGLFGGRAPVRNLLSRIGTGIGNGIAGIGNGIARISQRRHGRLGGSSGGWGSHGGYTSGSHGSSGGWGVYGGDSSGGSNFIAVSDYANPVIAAPTYGVPDYLGFDNQVVHSSMEPYSAYNSVNQFETSAPILDYGYMGSHVGQIGSPTNGILIDGSYIGGEMMSPAIQPTLGDPTFAPGEGMVPDYYQPATEETPSDAFGADDGDDDSAMIPRRGKAILSLEVPELAKVYINDKLTQTTGIRRSYASRNLKLGEEYRYRVKVVSEIDGKEVIKTRVVTMRPGEQNLVEFNFTPVVTRVVLNVPDDAKVVIDGKETTTEGSYRSFATRRLTEGRWEDYSVVVSVVRDGKTLTEKKEFDLAAGEFRYFQFDFDGAASAESVAKN